jgi:hypothetical protein
MAARNVGPSQYSSGMLQATKLMAWRPCKVAQQKKGHPKVPEKSSDGRVGGQGGKTFALALQAFARAPWPTLAVLSPLTKKLPT